MIPYGPDRQIVGQCDVVEIEYAAIRKSVALMDGSHRGLIRLTGKDRLDFLHRLTTQDCRGMKAGQVRRAMILDSKGRIAADLLMVHHETQTLIDTDIHRAATVIAELDKLLFGEDVRIEDLGQTHHRISLYGPRVEEVLSWWRDGKAPDAWDFHYDDLGVPGVHLWAPGESLRRFADKAADLGEVFKLKWIGWMAYNIARIEAGRVMFNIDFGPDNLPHETGPDVVNEAVSFTKGCYRGQEIVARMQSRGHPAKRLVGFRVEGDALPQAGVEIRPADAPGQTDPIGAVTSSTLSPMLGNIPVGFAMVKWGFHEPGTKLSMPAEGKNVAATVHDLKFYTPEST